jgi:hypothetical protein
MIHGEKIFLSRVFGLLAAKMGPQLDDWSFTLIYRQAGESDGMTIDLHKTPGKRNALLLLADEHERFPVASTKGFEFVFRQYLNRSENDGRIHSFPVGYHEACGNQEPVPFAPCSSIPGNSCLLLTVTFVFYYAPSWSRGRHGKAWQVTGSPCGQRVFYGWEDPKLIGLLAISCVGNSLPLVRIILHKVAGDDLKVMQWTRMAVIMNLALLGIFKYLPFIVGMLPFLPAPGSTAAKAIPLPIGISFYTFHGISMIVDVSRGEVTREGGAGFRRIKNRSFRKGSARHRFLSVVFPAAGRRSDRQGKGVLATDRRKTTRGHSMEGSDPRA